MKAQILHDHIIYPVLEHMAEKLQLPLNSVAARKLILATAAQESHCGDYFKQIKGPAMGIFQVEPATEEDLFTNFLDGREDFLEVIMSFQSEAGAEDNDLISALGNTFYQAAITRAQYYRFPAALPEANDFEGTWEYYKKYWNTDLGAATKEEFTRNWILFVRDVDFFSIEEA